MPLPVVTEGIKQNAPEEIKSLSNSFPKPFFWDSILFYLASTIFGLGVSSVVVDFFKSSEYSLACFTPFENQAQYAYINSYCHKHLPVTEYFSVALAIHATALLIPHYLWKVFFSAKFDFFFSHATKLETLHDKDTGEYSHINYSIADYLWKEFHDQEIIFIMYVAKLLLQFLLMLTSFVLNIVIFTDINFNITFECYDDNERSQLFGNVTCAYPKKLFINVLLVADYLLLTVAMIVVGYGLFWCVLFNRSSEDKTAQFCYDSCIDAKYYKSTKIRLNWKNDFKFLVNLLLATNTGVGRLFNCLRIENKISQIFNSQITKCGYHDKEEHRSKQRFEYEVIKEFYDRLCLAIHTTEIVPHLIAKKIIGPFQRQKFMAYDSEPERVAYLLDNYILNSLSTGNLIVFERFLEAMNSVGNPLLYDMATNMKKELSTKIEDHNSSGKHI